MEKFNMYDLLLLREALKVRIDTYNQTIFGAEREEKTLEKLNSLIVRYGVDD